MKINVKEIKSISYIPVIWYGDDEATITRVAQWRDFFLFGKEF